MASGRFGCEDGSGLRCWLFSQFPKTTGRISPSLSGAFELEELSVTFKEQQQQDARKPNLTCVGCCASEVITSRLVFFEILSTPPLILWIKGDVCVLGGQTERQTMV